MVDIVDKALRMGEGHQLKKLENVAKAVNALEDEISALSDEDLKAQTPKFKQEIENGKSLDEIMPEAFATVREVSKRTLGQRHFDVQLMGGAALHWGNIAEMKTGEGKTLVATLPTYLNALEGKGVHVVTVNDYLASYQSELMGRIYRFLGMNVGCIITEQKPPERRKQYNADITYGTNNEFGFDYLRDNMAIYAQELVQRIHGLNPWPGAVTGSPEGVLKLWRAQAEPDLHGQPGQVLAASPKEGLVIAAGEGAVRVLQLQAPGGKQMAAADYLRGHPAQVGEVWPAAPRP
mgnify:CR=1 FL=1